MSVMRAALTEPLLTASRRLVPQKPALGMTRSSPALAEATPDICPSQSLTTKPSKPSSVLRMPLSSLEF